MRISLILPTMENPGCQIFSTIRNSMNLFHPHNKISLTSLPYLPSCRMRRSAVPSDSALSYRTRQQRGTVLSNKCL